MLRPMNKACNNTDSPRFCENKLMGYYGGIIVYCSQVTVMPNTAEQLAQELAEVLAVALPSGLKPAVDGEDPMRAIPELPNLT